MTLPMPLLAATLVALWLLLTESTGLGSLLLGGILALAAIRLLRLLDMPGGRVRRPIAAVRLAGSVAADIVRSNYAVARIILRPKTTGRTSGFVLIPLEMRAPYGLAALACIITATPGTIWVEYISASNSLRIHVLDLVDENTWIRTIKDRYERRLMEIFE